MNKIILMYHCVYQQTFFESGFQNDNAWQYKVSLDDFESHVRALIEYCESCKIDKSQIEFTFDDGGVSFYTIIAPILEKYGLKGVFYISTKYIDTKGFLQKSQILELSKRGHIIGSHTHTHPINIGEMSKDAIANEWITSIKILEDITNVKVDRGSIPNGNGSNLVYCIAAESGLKILDTSIPTSDVINYKGLSIQGRFVIHNNTSIKEVLEIVFNSGKRKEKYIKWWLLCKLKQLSGKQYNNIKGLWLKLTKK